MSETTMLQLSDPGNNSNKFYEVTMTDNGAVSARWGRVGVTEKITPKGHGAGVYHATIASKTRKGYREVALVNGASAVSTSSNELATASRAQLAGDNPTLVKLVDRLVSINAHSIAGASGGKITIQDGQVVTALGAVTTDAVARARTLLTDMQAQASAPTSSKLGDYLTLIPQKVPSKRGWADDFFGTVTTFADQFSLLDQLEQSVSFATSQATATVPGDLFRYRLSVCEDKAELADLSSRFKGSANSRHASSGAKIVRVFTMSDTRRAKQVAARSKAVGNVSSMWHGSRAANVLSILSSGLMVPPSSARHVTGRMFGDGVYLSRQSTKSLNYSRGGVWGGNTVDRQFFMFSADVAMGRSLTPNGTFRSFRSERTGGVYDSINVEPGHLVRNHEAIVWDPDQITMRHLIEFKD